MIWEFTVNFENNCPRNAKNHTGPGPIGEIFPLYGHQGSRDIQDSVISISLYDDECCICPDYWEHLWITDSQTIQTFSHKLLETMETQIYDNILKHLPNQYLFPSVDQL